MLEPVTKNPVGRPRSGVETKIIAVRIPVALGERLDRYVDLATSRGQGMKASINSIVGFAIEFFLDAQEKPQGSTRPEPAQPSTQFEQTPIRPRKKVQLPIRSGSPRGRIIKLLQDHPEGLSPAQVKKFLEMDKDPRDTMRGMEQDGILKRMGTGTGLYAVDDTWASTFPDF